MNVRAVAAALLAAALLPACSGAGSGTAPAPLSSAALTAYGTLSIDVPSSGASSGRKPAFVSPATTHAALYIDAVLSMRVSCTVSCSFSWVSSTGTHTFAAELDNGQEVLGEGSRSYGLVVGVNALSALTVNGVLATLSQSGDSISANVASGTLEVADAGDVTITSTGSSSAFDNGSPTFGSSNASVGTVTVNGGTAITPNSTSTYAYTAQCVSGQSGTFNLTATSGTASGAVSTANLASGVSYPSTISGTVYSYTCTDGTISDTTGTIVLQ